MVRDFLCPTEKGRKKMKNWIKGHKKIFLGIVVAVVILIVVLIAVFGRGGKDDSAKDDQQTATVERRNLAESVSATGTFQASDDVNISADIMNTTVQEVRVSVGDTVAAGDVICVLDTADLQERLAGRPGKPVRHGESDQSDGGQRQEESGAGAEKPG